MKPIISYKEGKHAFTDFEPLIKELIDERGLTRICDIGGGANPLLNEEYIIKKDIDYTILDISETELRKAPKIYKKLRADISDPKFISNEKFDLIFSKMVAEHISDAKQFHKNILNCLSDKGLAVHFFPTLYTLPFFINYLIPEKLSQKLLDIFDPRDKYQHAKFPAYYRWCRGPFNSQITRLHSIGYEIIEYRCFFGHSGYYKKLNLLKNIHKYKSNFLLKHPNPYFTSYAYVILKKKSSIN